ncbi:MAG TPA: FkbM family methyltransferase [Acidobacteriota bacterium]|nr:FkbM family methyltransferase [Acidobacteriota bacterium]
MRLIHEVARRLKSMPAMMSFGATFGDKLKLGFLPWFYPLHRVLGFQLRPVSARIRAFKRAATLTFWSDEHYAAFCEIFIQGDYSHPVNDPKIIVDVGANVGIATAYFSCRYPSATIHALEPDPSSFRRLVVQTKQFPNVSCWNVAVSGSNGTLEFYSSKNSLSSSIFRRSPSDVVVDVKTCTLDSFAKSHAIKKIDFLKFDVEGAEWAMFGGSWKTPIHFFIGEYHEDLVGKPLDSFVKLFSGFSIVTRKLYAKRYVIRGTLDGKN